jgi:tape measure domain-containing protein
MAAEDYSIRINVDSSSATQAQANLNRLNSTVTQTERELNNTSSAARSAAASLSGLGSSSAGIHSMTAAMSSYSQSATQAANNTQSATREISQMGTTATRTSESMRSISNAIGLIGFGAFAKDVLNTNIEMENLRARLDATFGSMAKGQQAFSDILQIAKETPQSVSEISKSFVMLKNFGIEPTVKVMQDLTNMTSKVGGNADTLSGIVRGLGQAYAKGKLQAEEANQMIERGVPVYALLSKELHKTTSEIMDMMSSGELTRPVIEKLIASMGSSSVGASTKMMETLGGKISMLGDSWAQFENTLLNDKSEGLIKSIVTGWMAILDGFNAKMNQSISAQIVDLNAKLNSAENRKSFISKGMESLGIIDSPNKIRSQIESLKQKRLVDFQANRQYEQSQKQEKATQAEADAIAKKVKANDEFTKKFGTASQREKQEIDELKKSMGELTKEQLAQVHAKYFAKEASAAKSAAHKEEIAALREAKQQQDEYNRLLESTPYGEYNAQIDKLTSALKNGGINQSTYSTLLSEANDKLLTSTDYVKEHTKALDEQTRATERAFEATARGKFEKTDTELRAGRGGMSENEYLNKQSEMVDSYLKDTGNFKKDNSEKLTKAYENEVEALEKIRREIQLNDREQYESTQRHKGFTDEKINDLMRLYDEVGKTKLFDDMGLSSRKLVGTFSSMFQQIVVQGKSFTETLRNTFQSMIGSISDGLMKMGLSSGNIFAMIGGVAVGLLGKLIPMKDKTTDVRLADTALSESNSIQNVIRALNDIHAKEYKELVGINDNFAMLSKGIDNTIARAIAWNGSFTPSTAGMKGNQTVANKNPAGSPAMIAGGIAASTAAGAAGVGASAAAMAGLGGLSTAMSGAAISTGLAVGASSTAAIAVGGAVLGLAGGVIFAALQYGLGKLLGIGKTKYEAIGAGLVTQPAKMIDLAAGKAFEAYNFSTVKATTKGWFSDTKKIFDVINGYNDQMSEAFGSIFSGLFKTLDETVTGLGIKSTGVQQSLENAVVPMMKTTLSGKTDSEVSDIITKLVNTMTDKLATEIVGGMVAPFQKAGEATLETLYRLTTQVAVVKGAFHKLGLETDLTGMGAIAFADSITTIYESSINAKDGMKQFTGAINDFYNAVLTSGEKTALTISDYKSFVSQNPQLGLSADPSKVTGGEMMAAFTKAKEASESAAKAADSILAIGQDVKNAYAPETSNELKTMLTSSAWSDKITGDYKNITPESFAAGWWDIVVKRASTVGQENQNIYQELVRTAETNAAKSAQALPVVQAAGIGSLAQQEQAASAATQSVDLASKDLKKVTDMTGTMSVIVNEFQAKFKSIDETILKSATTQEQTVKRARDKELIELKKSETKKDTLEKTTIDWTELSEITRKAYAKFTNTTVEANDKIGYLTSTLQEVAWAADDADKSLKKLSDSGKYLMDFSRSIDAWIKNLRATSLGTPESQLKASQANFGEQMKLAQFGSTAEIKRQALSGITGYADTYINALKNYYASSKEGVDAIDQVIKEVSGLEKGLSVQELQLNTLLDIKDAIESSTIEIPKGISLKSEVIFKDLIDQAERIAIDTKANPTVENSLRYDAYASIILAIDKSAKGGSESEFIDKLIASTNGKEGLTAGVRLIVDSAEFSASQKESIISGVMADFNKQINFNVSESFKSEVERVNNSWKQVELPTTTTENAKTSVIGLTGGLKDLNGQYDVVMFKTTDTEKKIVDFSNTANNTKFWLDAESVNGVIGSLNGISNAAISAKSSIDSLAARQSIMDNMIAANDSSIKPSLGAGDWGGLSTIPNYIKDNSFLESDAVNAGYSGDYSDTAAMREFLGLPKYAKGGIANTPSIFGEAGAEAAVPLPDGRTIPVTLSRDSANDNGETVAELREISRKQEIMINTLIAAAQENRKQNQALVTEIEGLRTDTRLRRAA